LDSTIVIERVVSKYLGLKLTQHGLIVERCSIADQAYVRKVCWSQEGSGAGGLAYQLPNGRGPRRELVFILIWPFDPKVTMGGLLVEDFDMKGALRCFMASPTNVLMPTS
jgi:hypothetical protein